MGFTRALVRDLGYLGTVGAVGVEKMPDEQSVWLWVNLDWPTQITETEFFLLVKAMPKGKIYGFLSS
jgi:hypothetical protein